MTMKRISVFVSERQYEQFLAISKDLGQPYAELIREALNSYLQKHGASSKRAARKRVGARRRA
jgi:hypothetical protein